MRARPQRWGRVLLRRPGAPCLAPPRRPEAGARVRPAPARQARRRRRSARLRPHRARRRLPPARGTTGSSAAATRTPSTDRAEPCLPKCRLRADQTARPTRRSVPASGQERARRPVAVAPAASAFHRTHSRKAWTPGRWPRQALSMKRGVPRRAVSTENPRRRRQRMLSRGRRRPRRKVNQQTRHKVVEAFRYFESTETQRAFREILGMALQLGLEIRWVPRGATKYAFRFGGRRFQECVVRRSWISVYTTSDKPLHVETVDEVIPGIFGTKAARGLRNQG